MAKIPGKFTWFEHASPDPLKVRAFYEGLFNWKIETSHASGQPYDHILCNGDAIGGLRKDDRMPACWTSYASVANVDQSHAVAVKAGATSCMPPTDFGGVGRGSVIQDPQGAMLYLWDSPHGDRPDRETTPFGDWFWNELWTPDPAAALRFYKTVLGYSHDTMDMGMGTYYVFNSADGKARGGMSKSTTPTAPPMWLPYVHVPDCDACVAKARSLGARNVLLPPMDIPGIGRFAILQDPVGAVIAVIRGAAR